VPWVPEHLIEKYPVSSSFVILVRWTQSTWYLHINTSVEKN
jgi:hypothetical protein